MIGSLLLIGLGNQSFAQSDKLVVLETNLGNIVIEFFPEDSPNHVDNFIRLTESGFYDGTLFHRVIPGFMIQGGDPNTKTDNKGSWGMGGPEERMNAEFNTIKHNRGIVSMARSADPNSGGSQFFIVHQDSNFLDEQYTVFGRIVTDESFETLDKIATVKTGDKDIPVDTEQVKITKALIIDRSEISNILDLQEPERIQTSVTPSNGNQKFKNTKHEISISLPEGWLVQEPEKTQKDSPDIVAVGPKVGDINPVISLTVQETNQRTLDDLISEKTAILEQVIKDGSLEIFSNKKISINGNEAYMIDALGYFSSNDEKYDVKFKEVLIYDTEKFYTLAYSNGVGDFDSQLPRFEESLNSFQILSEDTSMNAQTEEGGGCLIATATFGSEMAPQVQLLREIRDNQLMNTESGMSFMTGFNQLYYLFSPTVSDLEREYPAFKETVKIGLTPLLSSLSIMQHAESDSEVLWYGVGVILLNIGMYFAAPAMLFYGIRK